MTAQYLLLAALLCLQALSMAFTLPCTDSTCVNGHCDPSASKDAPCICRPGYKGFKCDQLDNAAPRFEVDTFSAYLPDTATAGTHVYGMQATDPDASSGSHCADCASIVYRLEGPQEDVAKFSINPSTGDVTTAVGDLPVGTYQLRVRASNPGPFAASGSGEAQLVVTVEEVKSRERRNTGPPPNNVTFNYRQTYPSNNVTYLKMGEKLAFQVDIRFPSGSTTMNMEMFSPDNETVAVIMICDAKIISVGRNLNLNATQVMASAIYEGRGAAKWPYVRIALPFGTVVNNGSGPTNMADYTISVTYEAVFLYNNFVANNSEYWVSAGAEYNNESVIWIGQTSFLTNTDRTNINASTSTPSINITGDSTIYPGVVSSFNLDFTVPYLYTNFTVDIFGPLNNSDILSVCGVYTSARSGAGYSCVPQSSWPYDFTLSKQRVTMANFYRSTLSFTSTLFTNRAFRMPSPAADDSRISLTFAISTNQSAAVSTSTYVGASIDLSGTTVLSGYRTVTVASASAAPVSPNSTSVDPSINLTRIGPGVLGRQQSTLFELNIDTVPGARLDYEIQALMPANNSLGRMKICSMNVTYGGRNLPCLSHQLTGIAATFQTLYGNGSVPSDQFDYAVIRLSRLLNIGSVSTSVDPLANRITVRMVATVNNHSLNIPGETAYVTMGVSYADKQWVSISPINFTNTVNISSLPNESLPIVSLSYVLGDAFFNLGETAVVEAVTTLRRGVTYGPMDFEFIAPYMNDSAVMTVCGAEVVSVGKFVGCSDMNSLTNKIRLTSKNNSTNFDKAVFSLGTTSNVGPANTTTSSDDQIRIRFHVRMLSHVAHGAGNGSSYSLSYGMQFSSDQIWIGQLSATVMQPEVLLTALTADKLPFMTFDATNLTAYPLDAVTVGLMIKLANNSRSKFTLFIDSPTFGAVCSAAVFAVGSNLSCVNSTFVNASAVRTLYNTTAKEFLTQTIRYDLGYIHNSGDFTLSRDSNFDPNTLLLRVSIRTDASASGSSSVTARLFYSGSATPIVATVPLSVIAGTRPAVLTNDTMPTFSMSLIPLIDGMPLPTQYAPGQGFRARLTVTTKPNAVQRLDIRFVSPVNSTNVVDLLEAGVISAGRNVPCTVPWADQSISTKRNGSQAFDTVALNLGVLCNLQISNLGSDNQVLVDVFGRLWTNSAALPQGDVLLSTVIYVSDQQINVNQINITVNGSVTPSTYRLGGNLTSTNASFDTVVDKFVSVGDYVEVKLLLQVPEFFSSQIRVDLRNTDLNTSAWATINTVNISFAGYNMMAFSNEPYVLNRTSSLNTAQLDAGELLIYSVQNNGISTLKNSRFAPADRNNFTVTYTVRLADNIRAENGSTFQMSLGLHLLDRIVVALRDIKVLRTNNEWPDSAVQINISALPTVIYTSSDAVTVWVNITCQNTSTAELQNSIFYLHTPTYVRLIGMVSVKYASGSITATERPEGGIKFVFNNTIFLAENVQFSFSIGMRPNVTLPGNRETSNATSVYEFVYRMHSRVNNANSTKWYRKAGSVFFQVKGAAVPPDACSLDLGMNDTSVIRDCQITSFMAPFVGFEAQKSRPNLVGWKPHVRGGDYKTFRYVTVLFGTLKYVSRIVAFSTGTNKPSCLSIYKTMDGRAFTLQKSYSILSFYVGHVANFSLDSKLLGRGIRIGLCDTTDPDSEVTVRFDLFGCNYTGSDSYPFDPCSRRPFDDSRCGRSVLYTNDASETIYYCDHVPVSLDDLTGVAKCFKSTMAQIRKWQYLGPAVGTIVSYYSPTGRLYGYAQGCAGSGTDDRSYMVSDDGGDTWAATNPESFKGLLSTAASGTFLYSQSVNWTLATNFAPGVNGTACNAYNVGNWKLCYDGIYYTSSQVVSWNSCCNL